MSNRFLGISAALVAALIGASWQVITRFGVTTSVDALDLALMRYILPAIALLPILIRDGFIPRGVNPTLLLAMVVGGGLPFGLFVMLGANFAPVSHIAVLIPGSMPIFVALLAYLVLGDKVTSQTKIGFAAILFGISCIGWDALSTIGQNTIGGDLILLFAAFLWGVYSVAFRKSGLTPLHAAAIVSFWSACLIIPAWAGFHGNGLWQTPIPTLLVQIVFQGLLAGLVGMWIYGYAINQIGASQAASLGALVPALATIGGWVFLGETPSVIVIFGVALAAVGVFVANQKR